MVDQAVRCCLDSWQPLQSAAPALDILSYEQNELQLNKPFLLGFCYMQPTIIPGARQPLRGQMDNKLGTSSEFYAKTKACFPVEFYSFHMCGKK